ncbi:hypothetical protein [Undibacterium rugosum]|uniref:hypothetical protein n=1 Tax=Undibacterium rugosum TaxID=2762291 RepID=UPI001B811001|nr:hypothetical protein [Undibacterium rugosum]MBR7779895.1 hypothetical protein [Undibacterium rugosum]
MRCCYQGSHRRITRLIQARGLQGGTGILPYFSDLGNGCGFCAEKVVVSIGKIKPSPDCAYDDLNDFFKISNLNIFFARDGDRVAKISGLQHK